MVSKEIKPFTLSILSTQYSILPNGKQTNKRRRISDQGNRGGGYIYSGTVYGGTENDGQGMSGVYRHGDFSAVGPD